MKASQAIKKLEYFLYVIIKRIIDGHKSSIKIESEIGKGQRSIREVKRNAKYYYEVTTA